MDTFASCNDYCPLFPSASTHLKLLSRFENNFYFLSAAFSDLHIAGIQGPPPNANGIQDAGEAGVPGVTVLLLQGSKVVANTTTNSTGYYQFTNLMPGTYSVQVVPPPGYQYSPTQQASNVTVVSSIVNSTSGQTWPTTVPSGSSNETLNVGLYQGALPASP